MKTPWRLTRADTGALVVSSLEVADGVWSRFKGLQLRASLPPGGGLLLVPCASIHTFWMRFAIDVVMLDRDYRVLELRRAVWPWRIVKAVRGTHAILEMAAGTAGMEPGAALQLTRAATEVKEEGGRP